MEYDRVSLEDWQRNQPLSVLQLDKADRVVLRIAGKVYFCSVLCRSVLNCQVLVKHLRILDMGRISFLNL